MLNCTFSCESTDHVYTLISSYIVLTSWQAGTQFLASRMLSHSGEFPFHAKASSTCSSTRFRCLTTSRKRPSSARTNTSITCEWDRKALNESHEWMHTILTVILYMNLPCKSNKQGGQIFVRLWETLPVVCTRRWRFPDSRRSATGGIRPAPECPETYDITFIMCAANVQ